MSRASYSEVPRVNSQTPMYNPLFSYQEPLKDHTVCLHKCAEAFQEMRNYDNLKAAVFWNERWQNEPSIDADGIYHDGSFSNLRVNSSPKALDAYRNGVNDPSWLGRPVIGH